MINAKDAKAIADASISAIEKFVTDKVEPVIRSAAEQGKYSCNVDLGSIRVYETCAATPVEVKILEHIKNAGYSAKICVIGEPYIPCSIDEDTATDYDRIQNYGLVIRWLS